MKTRLLSDLKEPLIKKIRINIDLKEDKMNSNKKTARIAGLLYLFVAISAGFAQYFRTSVIVPGNVAATVNNVLTSELLFRIAIVSDLIGQIVHIFLALALYELFRAVNKSQALLMVILALIPVPIAMLNQINTIAVLQLLGNADYLKVFNVDQLHSQVMFFLNLFKNGVAIATIFWGLWLFPLGYLVIKSGIIPKIIGILLMVSGAGYVLDCFGKFLILNYNIEIALFTFIGEVLFLLWLLIKGVNDQLVDVRAPVTPKM